MVKIPVSRAPELLPKLHLRTSALFELGGDVYVYDTVLTDMGIAASGSNRTVKFYDQSTLQEKSKIAYHSDQITQIQARQNSFQSCSLDGQIAIWDLRQSLNASPALAFRAQGPVLSFDISGDDRMLVGGSRLDEDYHVARMHFWDVRAGDSQPMHTFENSHSDDITQIQFNKHKPSQMLSGSTDGLLCTYNVNETDEDEALLFVANTGASLAHCGYFGPESQFIYAHSDMETLQLWTDDASLLADFGDVRSVAEDGLPVDYMAAFRYCPSEQRLYMAAGTNGGDIHLLHVGAGSLEHVQVLAAGHAGIVRGFTWDLDGGWAVSGAEDGRLSLWTRQEPPNSVSAPASKPESTSRARFSPY
ncbi:hypothetical protein H4R99_004662 [Coemansia sp. RSA 1722]|nr:hypothetical protein LPJ57_008135 [Coemansia sp. RSA 486]KAJ2237560.1 hypothetical protein IWW45_000859 [Coemansia sp. RSA 485]KAJ2597057.1 hypothetical protein H4R99_004662 [Coemansia sp. RSA 1722]